MVRTPTSDQTEAGQEQWFRAWDFLTIAQRLAIIAFCAKADADVAEVALKI